MAGLLLDIASLRFASLRAMSLVRPTVSDRACARGAELRMRTQYELHSALSSASSVRDLK